MPHMAPPLSSPFPNQPLWTSELLHATFQQSDCTSTTFPVTLCPWVNIKINQTGIKLYSLVLSKNMPSLKQNSSQVSWHRTMLIIRVLSLECYLYKINQAWPLINKRTGWGNILNFIHIDCKISEKMDSKTIVSHTSVTLNESQDHLIGYQNIITLTLKEIAPYMSEYKLTLKFLSTKSHK